MNGFIRYCVKVRRSLLNIFIVYFIFHAILLVWWKAGEKQPAIRKSDVVVGNTGNDIGELDGYGHESVENTSGLHGSSLVSGAFKWAPDDPLYLKKYFGDELRLCKGTFIGINKWLALLYNVTINPRFGHGRRGGENISSVINQPENDEYFNLKKGYFGLSCPAEISYSFSVKSHLNRWKDAIDTATGAFPGIKVIANWTIVVTRYEYANLFQTMTDFYAAFLVAKSFKMDPDYVNILWIDGHPIGALDGTWKTLFGNISRAGELESPVMYRKMVWGIMGYDSPLHQHDSLSIPYLEEFRSFFLHRHGISDSYTLDCKQLRVMFIWRRDYLAHPRNPTGTVTRKIKNEDELLSSVRDLLPEHGVEGTQIDKMSMKRQLEIISTTDLLIGMHGAGLTHTLFLPKHAGLIELFPNYWPKGITHFRAMARWRHLHYSTWTNSDNSRELANHYTVVDIKAVINMVHEMHHRLCGKQADSSNL